MKIKEYRAFIFLCLLSISLISFLFLFFNTNDESFPKAVGMLYTNENVKLQKNINAYMELQAGISDIGRENYHCANMLYGYDEKFAYIWLLCQGFINGVKLEEGSGFSKPVRVEFAVIDEAYIIKRDYKEPTLDGTITLKQLFPKEMYKKTEPSQSDITKLQAEVRGKARASVMDIMYDKSIYKNERYGYTITYPAGWPLTEDDNEKVTIGIMHKEPSPGLFTIMVYQNKDFTYIDEYSQNFPDGCPDERVSDEQGYLMRVITCREPFAGQRVVNYFFERNGNLFHLSFFEEAEELNAIFYEMLGSFKLF